VKRKISDTAKAGLFISSATIAIALSAPAARAAGAPAATATGAPQLEEIVVTADRKDSYSADLVQAGSFRGAKQIDTPLTVDVIPLEVLQSQQALTILDALKNTPGVTSAQTSPTVYNNLSIRGIVVENRGNYRLNGSLPIVGIIDLPLEDKDRVEALKGASALYYGFTAPSGIINLTMKRPTGDNSTRATAFGDDNGSAGGAVDTSFVSGKFAGRINAVYANVDSGIDHTAGSRNLLAGAFDYKPLDNLTFSLDAEHIYKRVNEPGIFLLTQPKSTVANPYPAITLPPLLDPSTNFGPNWGYNRAEETNILGHMNWKISDAWALTVDAGSSRAERDRHFTTLNVTNFATGDGTLAVGLQPGQKYLNQNVRAELAGTFYTGPLLHEILVGASQNVRDQVASTSVKVNFAQNFFNPHPVPETPFGVRIGDHTRIDDIGYYAFDRIKFHEWLQVLGGVRYSDYTESDRTTGVTTFHSTPTSYSYAVVLKPREWASVYASYIEGLESTPVAPATAVNAGQQLGPTDSTQKEAGVKIEPHKGLLFQAAYFDIDRGSSFTNAANVFVVDGRARYKGTEVSLTGEVTRHFSIYASALFLSAKQESGAGTVISGTTITPTIVGKDIENTAKTTYSISGEYRLDQLVEGLSATAGVFYVGKRFVNPLNEGQIPGYTTVDLGASYFRNIYDHPTTFRINAQNVGNKKYWASTGALFLAEGAPSVVKFSVSTAF
jgi:iron complex outermembrane receptor protein